MELNQDPSPPHLTHLSFALVPYSLLRLLPNYPQRQPSAQKPTTQAPSPLNLHPNMARPTKTLIIDSVALLKVISHCSQSSISNNTGVLLGMEIDDNTIHVSSSFGHPEKRPSAVSRDDDDDESGSKKDNDGRGSEEEEAYEADMLMKLKAVNTDANIVGCYTSMFLGTFTPSLLSAPHPLVLLYDPAQSSSSATGNIVVRCFKLR
jgi:hypothetical protein